MSCPIKVNNNTIELTLQTSCYCIVDLLCVIQKQESKSIHIASMIIYSVEKNRNG